MDLRYTSLALANLLAGAFLVTATFGFEPSVTVALGFGVSIAVILVGLAMAYFGYTGTRRPEEKLGLGVLGLLTAALAAWTVLATTGIFTDDTARWLVFASGLGHVALAVAGIITHEAIAGRPAPRRRAPARRRPATRRR
jgi:zinc transporter ZupT